MNSIYFPNIETLTKENNYFRKVISTNKFTQLVLMSLKPGEQIGLEVHDDADQFFRIEQGNGKAILDDNNEYDLKDGSVIIVPTGTKHNIINTSLTEPLKLYSIYSPPHHPSIRFQDVNPEGKIKLKVNMYK